MLDRIFGRNVHDFLHLLGLTTIIIGLSFGKAFLSMGMLLMIANFLLEFKYKEAIANIRSNKLLLLIIAFYLIILIGLIWSIDFNTGLKDLKSRLPFLAIPLIIGARPKLTAKQLTWFFYLFLTSLLVSSLINFLAYNHIIGHREYTDIRGMSLFASHIRYGMLIALGVGLAIHIQLIERKIIWYFWVLIAWFIYYNYYSQILTGTLSLVMVGFASVIYFIYRWKPIVSVLILISFCAISVYLVFQFFNFKKYPLPIKDLPKYTVNGNLYHHSNIAYSEINGQPLYAFYCEKEMLNEWLKTSEIDFYRYDHQGKLLLHTLVRYMTAKNLTKDSLGFQSLTSEDIQNIEDGYTYPNERNEHLMARLKGVRHQIINNFDPNGHSLLQRFEYWKTSIYVIKKHWIIGVGTGGNQQAMNDGYEKTHSRLRSENKFKSHNMYFSILISYGIFGLVFFCFLLLCIFWISLKSNYLHGIQFLCVFAASFLIEDTLETQLGITTFAVFVALLVNHKRKDSEEIQTIAHN